MHNKRERKTIKDARRSGDPDRLYDALRAEAERQHEKMVRATLTYLEIGSELEALDSLRGDPVHA